MLATRYIGLTLKNPLVASAAPPNAELDHLRRLEDAGAAAVVLPSLFQEQIEAEADLHQSIVEATAESYPEALSYFPESATDPYGIGPEGYLEVIRRARDALSIPVIASLNGSSMAGWTDYARLIQDAGADALELNVYVVPVDLDLTGRQVEDRYIDILTAVREAVSIPIAVKLSPHVSALGELATRLQGAGADGLVLFNRLIQPDIELSPLRLTDTMRLSRPDEMRLPLLWVSLLAGRIDASLAASTGVDTADDVVKYLLAGADVAMTTSALLRHGAGHLSTLLNDLGEWIERRGYGSVAELRGQMSYLNSRKKDVYGRPSYMKMLGSNYTLS